MLLGSANLGGQPPHLDQHCKCLIRRVLRSENQGQCKAEPYGKKRPPLPGHQAKRDFEPKPAALLPSLEVLQSQESQRRAHFLSLAGLPKAMQGPKEEGLCLFEPALLPPQQRQGPTVEGTVQGTEAWTEVIGDGSKGGFRPRRIAKKPPGIPGQIMGPRKVDRHSRAVLPSLEELARKSAGELSQVLRLSRVSHLSAGASF